MAEKCSKVSQICSVLCLHSWELGLEVEGSLEVGSLLCNLILQGGISLSPAVLIGVDFALIKRLKQAVQCVNFFSACFLWLYRAAGVVGWGSELPELQLLGKSLRLLQLLVLGDVCWHPMACVECWVGL